MIRLEGQTIQLNEDVIDLIRKDPLHVWGWYDARITQAWAEITLAIQDKGLSHSPSPNRHDLVTRNQSFLELPHGRTENRRDPLSVESSLSAITGAEVSSISGRGVLCNTPRIRREKGVALNSNST